MALIDDFKAKFPSFNEMTVDDNWNLISELYPCLYSFEYGCNNCTDQAILFLLAHLFVGFTDPRYSGADAFRKFDSKSVGSVSVNYGATSSNPSALQEFYGSTPYGNTFLMLIRPRMGVFPG